jgi:hypothetical protein
MNYVPKKLLLAASIAMMSASGSAMAADATGSASVTVAQPIAVSETTSLNFGTITSSASAGTVVISTAGARSVTGGVGELGGSPAAASFSVTGEGNNAFSISLPSSASLTGPGTAMTVNAIAHNAGGTPSLSGGSRTFSVGATLNVGASQTAGAYTGTYSVTVSYN